MVNCCSTTRCALGKDLERPQMIARHTRSHYALHWLAVASPIEVRHAPVPGDLAVDDAHGIDGSETDLGPRARNAEKVSPMGTMTGLGGRDYVAISALSVKLRREIRKSFTQSLIGTSMPALSRVPPGCGV